MQIVRRGVPGTAMPPNTFADSELQAVVSYVRSLRNSPSAALKGDAHRGQQLFEGHGACLNCHRVDGKGSYRAADLSDIGALRSVDNLQRALLDPRYSDLPEHRLIRAETRDGRIIIGRHLNEDTFTVQLIDTDGHLVSLVKPELKSYEIMKGARMPSYREKLPPAELEDLVSYLSSLKGSVR